MPSNDKQRSQIAIKAAAKWRAETGVYIGYVMIYYGKFFEFSEELPVYEDRKNFPCAVDINDNVFVVVGNDRKWDNIIPSKREYAHILQEHISIVAKEEMAFCFPQPAKDIYAWFEKSKTGITSNKWKLFELITIRQACDCMLSGISLDRVLNGAVKVKRQCVDSQKTPA